MNVCFYTFRSAVTLHVAQRLIDSGKLSAVILQRPLSAAGRARWLARRVRRYGITKVADEVVFHVYYRCFLHRGDARVRAAYFQKAISPTMTLRGGVPVYDVASLNSQDGKTLLQRLRPDLVIMESRELIDQEVLAIPRLGFVGCHPGILPRYRGVYPSFWAMARGEPDQVGLSIYWADRGIDTGGLIARRHSPPKFPLQHFKIESERLMVEGVDELLVTMHQLEQGGLPPCAPTSSSNRLWTHIGLSDYLKARCLGLRRRAS